MTAPDPHPNTDVRMRGFIGRTLVETALDWIDRQAARLDAEIVRYDAAAGRVLAADVTAAIDVPAFDRSAMDGYALRGAETTGAGDYSPIVLDIIGEALPGRPAAEAVRPGTAVRIMTGAPLPAGADAVLPAEYAREQNGRVEFTTTVSPGKNVGRTGEDVTCGAVVLHAGRRLRPQDVGLLASIGVRDVSVVRRPRVRLLITGNELVRPGEPRGAYQIYEANSAVLRSLIERDGGTLESVRDLPDDRTVLRAALTETGADIVLVSGGSSVGTEDHAPSLVAEVGELAFHGMAMRPSSPAGMGRIGAAMVFLLPGNPVSCLCAYDFFAGRSIRQLGGRRGDWPYVTRQLPVRRKIVSAVGRVDYCRVRIVDDGIEPLALSGASILSSTGCADGFVIVLGPCEGYGPGTRVTVYLYDPVA